ncbi:MAG: vitamin B12 dependent-methionine synthase activation domain-containing protein, partial [Acidimicrobiia bacterium]
MRDNLDELTRRGLDTIPVLLGGAALTRSYVEKDLAGRYAGDLIYGKDAFAALAAMEWITGNGPKPVAPERFIPEVQGVKRQPATVPRRSPHIADDEPIPPAPFLGSRVVKGIPIDAITQYLNTTALLRNQWQYRPDKGEDDAAFKERMAPEIRARVASAQSRGLLHPQVVYGYFHASADGDDIVIWGDTDRTVEAARLSFPRQQETPWLCIADYFRPISDKATDVAAFQIVTMGPAISDEAHELFRKDRYEDYLKLHGIGVELTEALAECWHARVRSEFGIGQTDAPTMHGLFRQGYQGGRYSWGYPACPDLEDNLTVAELLDASRIGIKVGAQTGYQYQPEQTTSAIICHHRQAKYFIARKAKDSRADIG